ncbi:MAG: AI-2E family transporter [Candidatus Nanopelagicales bacterium]|nr:AI-2E family transporter [Candidatus Nanopelagicales bacterium]
MTEPLTYSAEEPGPGAPTEPGRRSLEVVFSARNVWRIGFVVIGLMAIAIFLAFVLDDGGGVIFTVLMAWFASIAMEPAVSRLAKRMRRGLATLIVMVVFVLAVVLFLFAFGRLFIDQIAQMIETIPRLIDRVIEWANQQFSLDLDLDTILEQVNLTPDQIADIASQVGGGVLGLLSSVLGSIFSLFTLGLLAFYLSADGPRLRRWVAQLFPARVQGIVANAWDLTAEKTGSYVAARVVLAAINSGTSAIVFALIGMPYWLALGLWTGIVAQFVPTIGTYISIVLPVIVGLLSGSPWIGIAALVWALVYQQVENLTFEPRISARAVDVHPAVAFASVLMGAALFGVAGALLAVPVTAMLLAMLEIYVNKYELLPAPGEPADEALAGEAAKAAP